ncbi:TonB-dependent receptor [bacterium]|nr:TonB-dependent receptor [bacterium]
MKSGFAGVLLIGFLYLCGDSAVSQNDSLKNYVLDRIIVTATRNEEDAAKTGRSVTVITENEIKNSPYRNIGELLGQQEGIYMVGTRQTHGSIQTISLRGANSNHSVVMVDGMRVTDPSSVDNAADISELSLANIERIEIVRGAHSTLYGSAAIGGVINIITKKNNFPGLNVDAGIQTGYFGKGTSELSPNAYVNYTFSNGFYANGEVIYTKVKGINAAVDTVTQQGAYKHFDNDGFRKLDLIGKIGYKNEKFDIFTSYKDVAQKSSLDVGAFVDDPNYTIDFNRKLFSYGAAYRLNEQLNFSYMGEYSSTARNAVNDSNFVDNMGNSNHSYFKGDYKGTLSNNEFQANLNLHGIRFVAGMGAYRETMTANTFLLYTDPFFSYSSAASLDSLDIHSVIYNGYVHVDIPGKVINENLSRYAVGLGGRVNRHSSYGNNFTYEVNPSYRLTERSLVFASYATGFNAPSLYRLFTPEKYYTSDIQRGNKNLKPETSVSYEVGYKQTLDDVRFSISWFYTKVKNYIDYVYIWDKNVSIDSLGTDFFRDDYRGDTYLNIGDQIIRGVEAGFNARLNSKLILFGNVTLIRGQLNYDADKVDVAQTQGNHVQLYSNGAFLTREIRTSKLIRRPNTGNLGVTFNAKGNVSLTGNAMYTGMRRDVFYDQTLGPFGALAYTPLKSYWSVDASARYAVSTQWIAYLKVENIFDEKTTEIRGFRNRGRGILINLRYLL